MSYQDYLVKQTTARSDETSINRLVPVPSLLPSRSPFLVETTTVVPHGTTRGKRKLSVVDPVSDLPLGFEELWTETRQTGIVS